MKIKLLTIPNVITLLNLLCGCLAAFCAFRGELPMAFYLIVAAAVFDFLDGFAARLLKAYSPLGKELDSLADMISFGFAPSAILLEVFQRAGGIGYWGFSMFLLAAFSALRLAKFNIDDQQTDEFRGLPTPACALLVASAGYLVACGTYTPPALWIIGLIMIILCLLLISNIRMFSLKFHNWGIKENLLRYTFLAASLVLIVILGIGAIPIIIIGYIAVSCIRNIACRKRA